MYDNPNAIFRPDLNQFVEEAPYRNKGFIGMELLPMKSVDDRNGHFPRMTVRSSGLMLDSMTERAPEAEYGEITSTWEDQAFQTKDYGLEHPIPDVIKKNMKKFFDIEVAATKRLGERIMRFHEKKVAETLIVPGDPAAGTGFQSRNATVAYTEANLATIDFVKDVLGVLEHMESTGYRPTTIVMTRPIFNLIVRSPKMTNFLYPSSAGQTFQRPINESDITRALGIDRLLIAAAHADRSKTKGTTTLQPIWNNNYIFFSDPKGGDFQEGGVGRTLVWNEEVSSGFFNTMSYRWEKNRTNRIRVHSYFTTHVIDYFSGVLVNLQP